MYTREVQRLAKTLNEDEHRAEAAGLIRGLIDRIVLTPDPANTRLMVDLEGDLAGILAIAANGTSGTQTVDVDIDAAKSLTELTYRLPMTEALPVAG